MKLFDNTAVAFSLKTDAALERAYFLFKLIGHQPLVRIGAKVAEFAFNAHLPVEGLVRATVFDQFCSGTSAHDSLQVVEQLSEKGVYSVLDYSVEGAKEEISLDVCYQNTLDTIAQSTNNPNIPFSVFKPTGFAHPDLLEAVSQNKTLSWEETSAWERVKNRFYGAADAAAKAKIRLLIDAEESWYQPAIDTLVEELMITFNRTEAVVFTTAQMYLKNRLPYLETLHQKAQKNGFIAGVKLVRGAYMEKEALYAKGKGDLSPVCATKKATDINFDRGWQFILQYLDHFALYFGSHNEASTYAILAAMEKSQITKNHPRIWFGQLYGMSDHITFNLAKAGYKASKYLPFGPVKDVLPYLIRRAEENTSVQGQTVRELALIEQERKRRKIEG